MLLAYLSRCVKSDHVIDWGKLAKREENQDLPGLGPGPARPPYPSKGCREYCMIQLRL